MKKFINNILLIAGILITLILAITMLPMEQDGYLQAYNKKCCWKTRLLPESSLSEAAI